MYLLNSSEENCICRTPPINFDVLMTTHGQWLQRKMNLYHCKFADPMAIICRPRHRVVPSGFTLEPQNEFKRHWSRHYGKVAYILFQSCIQMILTWRIWCHAITYNLCPRLQASMHQVAYLPTHPPPFPLVQNISAQKIIMISAETLSSRGRFLHFLPVTVFWLFVFFIASKIKTHRLSKTSILSDVGV